MPIYYISIKKCAETEDSAEYRLELMDNRTGRVRINKATGEVTLLEAIPDDETGRYFARAERKLKQHWEKGEMPEVTCWAS